MAIQETLKKIGMEVILSNDKHPQKITDEVSIRTLNELTQIIWDKLNEGLPYYEQQSFIPNSNHFWVTIESGSSNSTAVILSNEEFSPKFVEDLIFDITDLIFQTGKQAIKRAELWNKAKRSIEKIDFPEQCDWEFLLSIMIIRFKIKHSVELYVRWLKFIKVSLDEDQFFNNELSDSISLKNLLENKIF